MPRPNRILIVVTRADMVSGKKTGNWFDEVTTPYKDLLAADFQVVLSSPRGGSTPIDHLSRRSRPETPTRFLEDPAARLALTEAANLSATPFRNFDGAFFPGGYGQLWDLTSDSSVLKMILGSVSADTPVATVSARAPAILRDAKAPNGDPLVEGRSLTGVSDSDDDDLDLSRHSLFLLLESALIAKGANYARSATNRESHVPEDGADHWSDPRQCSPRRATHHELGAGADVSVRNTCRRRAEPR
jgi:putative intracellular protease/amidase